ncbi:hypothetical protein SLA2020_261020 [Shorea laevis]
MESDEEIRRVPEIGGKVAGASVAGGDASSVGGPNRVQPSGESQRKRGRRSPANKENKCLKRLLRNRVSAQQEICICKKLKVHCNINGSFIVSHFPYYYPNINTLDSLVSKYLRGRDW